MPDRQLHGVIQYLRRIVTGGDAANISDGQLLERFVTQRDEAAFELLVWRHSKMVLGVCRRMLCDVHAADDAFQASFLALARRAASISKRASVGGWLYKVAYRVALEAKARTSQRATREQPLHGVPLIAATPDPSVEAEQRELRCVIDDEVNRLPEKYRAPFVLCYFEGKSNGEAAHELGCPLGTVESRLTRARERLRHRLTRRGFLPSVGLSAVVLSESVASAGLPRVALNCTIRAALSFANGKAVPADLISAEVAGLAKGVLQSMSMSTFKFATGVLLLIGCVTGAGVLTCQAFFGKSEEKQPPAPLVAQNKAPARTTPEDKKEAVRDPIKDDEVVTISGRVLDPEGKPLQGAKIYLCTNPTNVKKLNPSAGATTGADGKFRLSTTRAVYEWGATLVATSRGFGPEWTELRGLDPKSEPTLRLAKDDVPITGRVLDLGGQPISGATVQALHCEATPVGKLDSWLKFLNQREKGMMAAPPAGFMPNPEWKVLEAEGFDTRVAATTDAKGTFRLDGFGRERVVYLKISGPGIEQRLVYVATRPGPAPASVAFYHATFDHLAGPSKPIVGIVREKGTGRPLAGVLVELMGPSQATATTDNEGRYRLDGVGKAKQYALRASGDEHFHIDKRSIADTKGREPLTVDFELERGLVFQGRLTDRASGKPVRAGVFYFALAENPHAKDYASLTSGSIYGAPVQPDGSFRLLAIPGPGLLCASAADTDRYVRADLKDWDGLPIKVVYPMPINPTSYHTVVRIEPSEKDPKSLRGDIQFEAGKTLTGRIERPDGRPLPGALAAGLSPVTDWNLFGRGPLKTAEFKATGLRPGRPGALVFLHADEKLGKVQAIQGDETGPLTVRLEPLGTLAGRVRGPEGRPVAGVEVIVSLSKRRADYQSIPLELLGGRGQHSLRERNRSTATTDPNGAFRIQGLIPGLKYELLIREGKKDLCSVSDLSARAGQLLDLGDLGIPKTPQTPAPKNDGE